MTNSLIALHSEIGSQQVRDQINYAVAAKSLDTQKAAGDAANKLLQSAVRISKQAGLGNRFDAFA